MDRLSVFLLALTLLISATLAIPTTVPFRVFSPRGPSPSGEITCDTYANVSWDAASMPSTTHEYDVLLLAAPAPRPQGADVPKRQQDQQLVSVLIRNFPQDRPPVGFANFYPRAAIGNHEGSEFVIAVVAKDGQGNSIQTGYSPSFKLPMCAEFTSNSDSESDVDDHDNNDELKTFMSEDSSSGDTSNEHTNEDSSDDSDSDSEIDSNNEED